MLDLGNAQQRGDDGQRLVETGDRLIGDRPQFLQRCGVLAPALEAHPHAGERRAQVMGDVVADAGNFLDESFDLAQHPVDAGGELIERVIAAAGRQALAQIACHDTLDSSVDLREPICERASSTPIR